MSGRVAKSKKSRSADYRSATAAFIREQGLEVSPCTRCFDKSSSCWVVEGIDRCSGCFLLGRSCDSSRVPMANCAYEVFCCVCVLADVF
jgi:hypothetical protein